MKHPVLQTETLWDVFNGIYKVTTYYDDGTFEDAYIPKGDIIIHDPFIYFSHTASPEEFPKVKTVNCFHPKIAQWIVNMLKWFSNVRSK